MKRCSLKYVSALFLVPLLGITIWVDAGDLNPPEGPVTPTMKTLVEVEPRTPVQSLPGGSGALYVISEPGSYYLTANIVAPDGFAETAISITTDYVTLDLNGFAIVGATGAGFGIRLEGARHISIYNGTVRYWAVGVFASETEDTRIEAVRADENETGLSVSSASIVLACLAHRNQCGILADNSVIRDCAAKQNLTGISVGVGCTVSHCSTVYNLGDGIVAYASTVTSCTATVNDGDGIRATNCLIRGNTALFNGGENINADTASTKLENHEG